MDFFYFVNERKLVREKYLQFFCKRLLLADGTLK